MEKAYKVVEDPRYGISFSYRKDIARKEVLYWKARLYKVTRRDRCYKIMKKREVELGINLVELTSEQLQINYN